MIHVMLPVQYLAEAGARQTEPQKRLMLAVLQTAVDDCRGSRTRRAAGHPAPVGTKAYHAARAYLTSTDRTWPYTFENLCDALGLDASSLRRSLMTSSDAWAGPRSGSFDAAE